MSSQRNGVLLGLPDRFVAVEIETEASPAFNAAQYSFFGDLSAADSALEGVLEDCLEALPDEDGLTVPDYGLQAVEEEAAPLEEEEDLSVASMFRNQLGLGPAKTPTARVDPDEDAGMDALLTDPLSVARKQDDEYDQRGLPLDLYPQPVSNSRAMAATTQPQSFFGDSPGSYGLFEGYNSMMGAQSGNADGSSGLVAAAAPAAPQPQSQTAPPPSSAGTALLQMLSKPSLPAKAMTLEELEARMLSSAEAAAAASAAATAGAGAPGMSAMLPGMGQPLMPGQLLGMPGARGPPVQGPRMAMPPGAGPPLYPQMQPPPQAPPGAPHGMMPPMPGMQPVHLHGMSAAHGPMQQHMIMMQSMQPMQPTQSMQPMQPMQSMQPPPGSPGSGMYAPMMGGHMGPGQQPKLGTYGNNGMVQLMPHHQPHHNPAMMQPSAMGQPYGPGPLMPPRPMHFGPPAGMGGPAGFMHDGGYPQRPAPSAGGPMHGPMQGMPHRPGPFAYGSGPGQQMPGPQRPFAVALPPPPPPASGGQRPPGVLGPGAAGSRPPQPRQAAGQEASYSGQQSSRGPGMLGNAVAVPVALAAAAAAAGRAGGAGSGPGGRLGGNWMRPEDVEYVVRSMLYSVANGVPYVEDYYYQAFVHKHISQPSRQQLSPGAFPMAAPFVPELLRDLSEDQMHMMRLDPSTRAKFVEGVHGLGKIVLSNIRTPKVLMDLSDRGGRDGDAKQRTAGEEDKGAAKGVDDASRSARPLEQEPLLAARIMIEDCLNLLLDVDDIDRLATHIAAMAEAHQRATAVAAAMPLPGQAAVAASATTTGAPAVGPYGPFSASPPPPVQLRQRRDLLLAGINGAFRLPSTPSGVEPNASSAADMDVDDGTADPSRGAGPLGDGVLLRILALSKGRGVVARALMAIAPPASLAALPGTAAKAPQEQAQRHARGDGAGADADAAAQVASSLRPDAGGETLLGPDAPRPFVLLWAALRNAWMLFGSSLQQGLDEATERSMLDATARLAVALRDALLRLPTARDAVDAAAAFNAGCQLHAEALCLGKSVAANSMEATLLPLAQTRSVEIAAAGSVTPAPSAWLGEALAALVTRASQLGLAASPTAGDEADVAIGEQPGAERQPERGLAASLQAEWSREFGLLHNRISRHLATLGEIHSMARASSKAEALAVVRALCCRLLVNAMLQHATAEQAQQLKGALQAFAA